ncbi:MAG TPA: DUF3159 domain-containing protein [Jatrophihabitans sp.]
MSDSFDPGNVTPPAAKDESEPGPDRDPARPATEDLRERTRQQMLDSFGGWSGTLITAIPPVVFVAANAWAGLHTAIIAALASGVVLALYRLVRKQSIQQAVTGLFSVAVAAAIAARTGQARGFFLLGIVAAIGYAAVFAVSIVIRRPLVGLLWEFLDPTPLPEGTRWHKVPRLFRAYLVATLAALAMFASRAIVQLSLFKDNKTGLLAVTKLLMGYPLYIAVVALAFWVVRRAKRELAAESDSVGADGQADRGLSLRKSDEE